MSKKQARLSPEEWQARHDAADNAVQIHGGDGCALEFPVSRLLCDARILNVCEGAPKSRHK